MAVPEIIPIAHEPGYRTDTIGRYDDGQFLASVTYAFRQGDNDDGPWEDRKLLFVVLHTFDGEGRHRDSDISYVGTEREVTRTRSAPEGLAARANSRLARLLDALPGRRFTDIAIRPFEVVVDDVLFGLVVERRGDGTEGDWVELHPDDLGFGEPWDGLYDT